MEWTMKFLIFHLILKPLIKRNYRLRLYGKLPDEWFWADTFAVKWGYSVEMNETHSLLIK